MSANCTLTPEAREDLVVLVAKNMMDMADATANLNIKNYMTEMYNKLEPALGEVQALVYASYVPKVLTEVIPFDSRILNLVLDSEVNMNELYSLSKRLSDPTTVLELTKKELQLKDVKKKKVKRLNKSSKSKKKASAQFELDFENGAYVYKRGTKVKILKGNNKGEIWTVVADESLINGSNRVTVKSPDGKSFKNFSKKSIEFVEGLTPELSATALSLQYMREDLKAEENSIYRNQAVIDALKDGIAELEYMLANNSKKPLTPQEKQKGKKPVPKKRTSNDDLLEMRHHERREGVDSWSLRTRAERNEEELRVSKSGSPQTEAEETKATYTKEELDGMAQELMQLEAEVEEAKLRVSEEFRDTIPHAVVIDYWEKITPASAKKETGTKVGTRSDIHISLLSKEGKSVERAAESMAADHGERLRLDDVDFKELIIDVLMAGTLKNANETLIGTEDNNYKLERIAEIEAILDRFISSDPNTNQPKQDNKGAVPIAPITGTKQKAVEPNVIPINKVEPQVRINAVAESKGVFQANAPSVLVTTGREAEYKDRGSEDYRVPYDKTKLMYKIQRNILAKIGKSKNNRGSDITLGKYRDGVYLTVMHKNNPALDTDLATLDYDPDRLGVFLVVTDKTGTPLRFNSTTGGVANEGEQAIYPMHPTKNIIGADGEKVLSSKELRTAAQALAVARSDKNNVAKYQAQIISEAKELHKLKMYALQNQNDSSRILQITSILQITGGSMGFIQQSNYDRTLLKGNVDTRDLTLSLDKGIGVIGYRSGSVDELHGSKLQLEKPTVKQSGVAETIKSLLFDDLLDINDNQISYEQRRNMLRLYLPVNTEFIQFWRNKDEETNESLDDGVFGEYNLEIGTVDNNPSFDVDFNNPASIEEGKQLFDRLVNEVREKDKNKKYNTQYNQFKLHVSKEDINKIDDKVSMPVINGNVVEIKKVKYMDLVVNNNFQVNTKEIGADKKLRRTNSYFQFSINPADFIKNKEAEETSTEQPTQTSEVDVNETATQETNEIEAIENQMESDELDITSDEDFNIDDSIKEAKKKKGNNLFTALDVKQKSLKATQAQIEAAKEWYESSPISKYISFTEMFKTINSDAVAQWSADGIVLFNGSDYSDLYHEAFHGFSQTFLNKKQRKELYDEVRKKEGTFKDYKGQYATFKKATDKQIEEHLAEGFREYMLKGKKATKGSPKQNSFFRRIWNALKALFTGTTARDVATNNASDKYVKELYEKLRVGNLHEYSYDVRNAQFGNLNSGIVSSKKQLDLFKPNELTVLNYQNSKTVIDMVDYFMSDFVDLMNSELSADQRNERNALYDELHDPNIQMGIEERKEKEAKYKALKDKATYQWTASVTNDKNVRAAALGAAKKRLNDLKNIKAKAYASEKNATEKIRLRNDYYMLKFAVDNFGNLKDLDANDPIDGADVDTVIGYHKLKTKVFDTEFKIQDEQAQGDEAFIAATQGFTRNGNENSLKELAKSEIVYLLKTLPKFEKDKKTGKWEPKLNRFGIPELNDYQATWNRLARGLENSQDFDLMYKRLQGVADKYPPAQELINRMGNPYENMTSKNEHGLWTNFWQTFNKARVPLVQMMVEEDVDLTTGELMRLAKIGEAFNADKAIQRRWQNQMAEAFPDPQTNYLLKDKEGNYLNMEAVLQDYPTAADASADAIGFYRAIGFDFTETDEIYEALSNDELKERYDPQYFHTDLVKLNNSTDDKGKPIIVRDLSQLIQGPLIKGKATRMKDLLALEAAYSDSGSNFMVTNAEGNTQFEHTLNNSMTMMVSSINNAETYQQLIDMPHMEDLNIETNPFAASSIWLQSIFDLDPTSPRFGEKRKHRGVPVTLKLTNLSGVIYQDITINEETGFIEKGIGQGVSSAAADEFSKLILDLHLNAAGIPELMRHADKGTSYSISISGRIIGNSNAKDNYIPMEDFSGSSYQLTAYERLMPQITAEISRSNTLISYNEMNNGKGIKNYDYNYIKKITDPEKGKFFYQFDAVLTPETKALLKKETAGLTSQVKILEKIKSLNLEKTIRKEMNDYFQKQFLEVQGKFNEARFVGSNTRQSMINAGIAPHNINDTFVRSAVYNSFIHNIESLNLIYGDLAQFNENKDGFHKRNAGAGSTGTILRTDKVMQNYINNSLWENSYAYAQGHTQHLYTGRAKTAIVENMDVDSIYKDDYAKAYKKANAKDAKKADAYDGQDEADAQGLISFDAYRQFKVAEGSWSDAHDALYDAIVSGNGDKINPAKVTKFFPVIKGQYWGRLNDSRGLLPVTGMHKYSLFPLIPTVIKNKKAQVLHEKMSQEGIAYVTFESGSKVGIMQKDKNSGLDKLFVDQVDRNLTEGLMTADGQVTPYDSSNPYFTPNVINLEFFKNQLEIHDESKGSVIFSTQLRKLIEDGLFKNGVPVDFASKGTKETRIKKWEALTEEQKEEASPYYVLAKVYESNVAALTKHAKEKLLEEIGWTFKKETDGTETIDGSMESLMKMVKAELTRQDLGDHSIDYIQIDADGNLKHDLSGSFFVEKLEKVLNALMVKRLVNQKVNGEGLIQVASTLFEDAGITQKFRDATQEELKKYKGTNDLPNYIQGEGPNGETSACKVKVALRGDFVKLLNATHNDGKRIGTIERLNQMIQNDQWLNTGENRRMITMTGVRIPVQGMNSMEFMEVYEFLPAEAGSVIIPPTEIVTKSGADFDVDKMTVMMPNLAVINGKTEVIKKVDVTGLNKEEVRDKLQSLRDKRKALTDKWDNVFNEKDRKKRQAFFPFTDEQNQKLDEFAETVDPIWAQIKELLGEKKEIKKTYQNKKSTLFNKLNRANTKLENLYDQLEEVNKERQEYVKVFAKEAFEKVVNEQKAEMENINIRIANTQRQLNGFTSKGIENALISNIAEILALPSNFIPLTTPNSTELLDESSDEMSEFATDYDPYSDGNFILDKDGNKKSVISPTKALEMGYNLDKHSKNAIGKDVLGIGAVDNTYNTLFNRVGVYLNPATVDVKAYNKAQKKDPTKRTERENEIIDNYQRVTIRMPHNTRKVDGLKAIELSDIEAKDKNKVSDVVNQMINGWVDIAADPWIFNIQGNKEVGPTLLFLIQAGVPIKEAIYFVSNPIIREYVKQQKLYKSPLARAFGKEISNPSFAKNNAVREILTDERFGFNISDFDLQGRRFNSKINELIKQTAEGSNFDSNDLKTKAKSNINRAFDSVDREIFIHFLQLEKITGSVRDIKMRTNVDTTKDASLFAAVDRIDMLTALETDPVIPNGTAAKFKGENNDGYNSPISSFFIQQFQIDLLGDGFPLRNHNVLNQFIRENLDKQVIDDTYGNKDSAVINLKSDLVNYMFQNELRYFDINNVKDYLNYPVEEYEVANAMTDYGAVVKDGKIYIDKRVLKEQWEDQAFATVSDKLGVAKTSTDAFNNENEYYHFVIMRELFRNQNPIESLVDSGKFKSKLDYVSSILNIKEGESEREYLERMLDATYEVYLRDEALHRTFNHYGLFESSATFAEEFVRIRETYKSLVEEYPGLMNRMQLTSLKKSSTKNLALTTSELDADDINIMAENLYKLQDRTEVGNLLPDATAKEISEITQFFNDLEIYAFLQSGLNMKSSFALNQFVPQVKANGQPGKVLQILDEPMKKIVKEMDENSTAIGSYLDSFYRSWKRENKITNRALRVRGKNYSENKSVLNKESMFTGTSTPAAQKVLFQDQYKNLKELEQNDGEVDVTSIKNNFTVTPIGGRPDKKATIKASIATQYIGFGEGIPGSSTASYAKQAGVYANTGSYTKADVIFVSISGNRTKGTTKENVKAQQDATIREAIVAIEAGATILTDNKAYTDTSNYNTGEKRLYANMDARGYNYSEITVDGEVLGTWAKAFPVTNEVTTVSSAYGVVTANNEPDKARTKLNVDLIAPQIAAQAYKENNSATANDMFSYGLRWTRKGNAKEPINNHSSANKGLPTSDALAKDGYVYDTLDQNGNPLAPVSDLQPIIDELEATLGLDMSNYDAVLGNIYLPGQKISTHRDTTESISAREYPVVVYTIGNDSGINIYENVDKNNVATGKPSFASDRKTSIPTTNGSIYTFGMDGKGRFEMGHDTPAGIKRDKTFPPITLPNGDVITNYTITLTFRRAGDLTGDMSSTPTQPTTPSQNKLTDRSYDPTLLTREEAAVLAHNDDNNIYVYNLATENTNGNTNGDKAFHGAGPNVFGIPSIRAYRGDFMRYFNDNADGTIDPVLKDLIDKAIQGLVDKKGKNLIFSEEGYGREFIEKDSQGKYLAPQAFLYLSEQLFEKFGYINPGYLTSPTGRNVMQESLFIRGKQTITDKQIQKNREEEISELSDSSVKEFMKYCNI